ncbi:MAG: Osmotically-inducible protein precursor [Francisellaceae bacterium]|nr:Osmotically-inducible protein precursor [Francisellaceae bacterium]
MDNVNLIGEKCMKSDQQIHTEVIEKLNFEPMINEKNIAISIHEGIATVGGTVKSYAEKLATERAIRSIKGVKALADELKVSFLSGIQKSDPELAKTAAQALTWDILVPSEDIKVTVDNGWLTLSGKVKWNFQKMAAERAIRNLQGVSGITNEIVIKPQVSPVEVKDKITKEFERNASIDAANIQVEVEGTRVILNGKVRSWTEIQEAKRAVWSIPGITELQNNLTIVF